MTALRYGAELARRHEGTLTALFVNDPLLGAAAAAAAYDVRQLSADTKRELRRLIERALGDAAADVAVQTAVGHPAPEIQKAAKRLKADLLVMGARGVRAPGKWFLGSVTERVLRATSVPVLVVPRARQALRKAWRTSLGSWPAKRILVPVDLADCAERDVRAALAAVADLGGEPILLHAVAPSQLPAWMRLDARSHDRKRLEAAVQAIRKLSSTFDGAKFRVVVGDPAAEISENAARLKANLIVLTLKRSVDPFGPRRGAITYRVLCDDVAPILALPEKKTS